MKCGRSSALIAQQSSIVMLFCHYKSESLTGQLSTVSVCPVSVPGDLIRHINEWVYVEKQCKVGGNSLCVHLAWPLVLWLIRITNKNAHYLLCSKCVFPFPFSFHCRFFWQKAVFLAKILSLLDNLTNFQNVSLGLKFQLICEKILKPNFTEVSAYVHWLICSMRIAHLMSHVSREYFFHVIADTD